MDVQRRDSQSTFIIFSPWLFIFKSLGGTLRQLNSSLTSPAHAHVEKNLNQKQALVKRDEKHHH